MSEPMITIVIPVYNVEPHIRKCVDSILGQTYRQIEVILVDDDSPDNCGAICDEYSRNDNRVTVIHTENRGVYAARNKALDVATGDYLMFIDSDDWVEPYFCETSLKLAIENDVQMVAFMYNYVFDGRDGSMIKRPTVFQEAGCMNASDAVRHLILRDSPMGNYLWNKLYKRSLFDGVRFEEGRLLQDQAVVYLMMLKAGRVYVSNAVLYNYLQRPDSITGTMNYTPKMYSAMFSIWQNRLPILKQYSPENVHHQMMQLAGLSISGVLSIRPDGESQQIRNEMKGFLSANKADLLKGGGKRNTMIKIYLYYYCRPLLYIFKYVISVKQSLKHSLTKHSGHYD